MATQKTTSAADPVPFRCAYESAFVPGSGDDQPAAALQINPAALPISIAGAALSRADQLHKALTLWVDVSVGEADAREVAQHLEPMAEEVSMLLSELVARLTKAQGGAA